MSSIHPLVVLRWLKFYRDLLVSDIASKISWVDAFTSMPTTSKGDEVIGLAMTVNVLPSRRLMITSSFSAQWSNLERFCLASE